MLFDTVRQNLALLIALSATGYAIARGGRQEQAAGLAMLAAWVLSPFVADTGDWLHPQVGILLVDLALLGLLLWIALRTDRYWPLAAAALHLLGTVMHAVYMADPSILPRAYITVSVLWSYLVLAALVLGVRFEARARILGGLEPAPRARAWFGAIAVLAALAAVEVGRLAMG